MVGGWNWLWTVSRGIIGVEPSGSATRELISEHQERFSGCSDSARALLAVCSVKLRTLYKLRGTNVGAVADKVKKKYGSLGHSVLAVQLERGRQGLGLSLAGHKDRSRMAVFVCGLNPNGAASRSGGIQVGDEILEVTSTFLCFSAQYKQHAEAYARIFCPLFEWVSNEINSWI